MQDVRLSSLRDSYLHLLKSAVEIVRPLFYSFLEFCSINLTLLKDLIGGVITIRKETTMNLTIRKVDLNNSKEVTEIRKVGSRAFFNFSFLWLFLPKPTADSFIALLGDEIVSAFLYKVYGKGDKQIAYINYFFTDPKHHGKGYGKQLFSAGMEHIRAQNFMMLVSFVRDDNVGSWLNFVKNGFLRVPFTELIPKLGFGRAFHLYAASLFGFCFGHDFYISENGQGVQKEPNSFGQIVLSLLVNAALLLPLALTYEPLPIYSSFLAIFVGLALFGYIGTRLSERKWNFRLADGGLLLCSIFSITMGFMPMSANWYPERYENTPQFRRDIAMPSIFSWVFLIALGLAWSAAAPLVSVLLIFRCMIFAEPMKSYGGLRVYEWNKGLFWVLVAASVWVAFIA